MSNDRGSEDVSPSSRTRRALRSARKHLSREWPSALFVASLVTIANLQFNWLEVLDAYTYVALGNMTSFGAAAHRAPPRAAVVIIDQGSHELTYGEVSPLNRCILRDQLASIYAALPDLVVVDLDLSPAPWVPQRDADRNRDCNEELLGLITSVAVAPRPIKTVLLDPFEAVTPELNRIRSDWKSRVEREGKGRVRFANGELPVNYGVHISPSERVNSIARIAMELSGRQPYYADVLDTRRLLTGLRVFRTCEFNDADDLTRTLQKYLPGMADANPGGSRVVFFGGGYGADDIFLSVIGEIWGVEAHAAAYVGERIDECRLADLLIDIVIALLFGLVIAFFWHHYFNARLHERPVFRELAKLLIVALAASVLLLVVGASLISYWLLLNIGLWLSPLPIAIGMVIDSFVSGSVDQATHKFAEMRTQLIEQRRQLLPAPGTDNPAAPDTFTAQPRIAWCARNLPWALGGEICDLLADRKRVAAGLLLLWTLVWLSTAAFAVKLTLVTHS